MTLKTDLETEVAKMFRDGWSSRDGTVVPSPEDIGLGNEAVKLTATVLYADLADSTQMVEKYKKYFSAEIYKTFLHCAAKIVRNEGGAITAYDGDRIMAVFIGDSKNTSAVRTAMKIKFAVSQIIHEKIGKQYKTNFRTKHVVGIDTSELFIARTGVRGYNDLVWVGRAANFAAKLSSLPSSYTYITAEIYNNIHKDAKYSNGSDMWTPLTWNAYDGRTIYRSSYYWTFA